MKTFGKSIFAVLALGLVLFGCQPDNVDPSAGKGKKDVAGAFDATHATLDTVCKYTDSIFFRSASGSYRVDKCIGAGGVIIPCVAPQMKWGSFVMYNGYEGVHTQDPIHWLDVDFSLAGGWFCDFTNWAFVLSDGISLDPNTGLPVTTGNDWNSLVVNPYRNQWKVAIKVADLPGGTFDMACRMTLLRLKLNGMANEGSRTTVWAINHRWNETGSEYASNNEYAIRYTPLGCLQQVAPPRVETVCRSYASGVSELGNGCTTLSADSSGAGITYAWSTGATTETISVCPTASSTYSVTVTAAGYPRIIKNFNVTNMNVGCSAGNSPHHKVRVCHRPPGNPNNVQNICIDWSAVPAHVAAYRPAGSQQGHDSGCSIGVCGSNPCQ